MKVDCIPQGSWRGPDPLSQGGGFSSPALNVRIEKSGPPTPNKKREMFHDSSPVTHRYLHVSCVLLCGHLQQPAPSQDSCSSVSESSLGTIDILGWIILCCGGCPVHCRSFSSSPGLSPLDASSTSPPTPPSVTTKNVYRRCQMPCGGKKSLQLRNQALF